LQNAGPVRPATLRLVLVSEQKPGFRIGKHSGVLLILTATGVAGAASYVVTWLVPNQIGLAHYALFAVFWSFLYLIVGTLSGIQQEVARGTRPTAEGNRPPVARVGPFAAVAALVVFLLVLSSAPAWLTGLFPVDGWSLAWPLAVGASSYVIVAALAGSLYGISRWVPVAMMVGVDALLRLAAVGVTLTLTRDVVALAWAVVIPFPGTLLLLWFFIRRSIAGRAELDVGYRPLAWNIARTLLAAASTSAMVSGFPVLLGLTSPGAPRSVIGLLILVITLTRAPLIIVAMSLQSYFIVTFRSHTESFWRTFLRLQFLVLGGGIALAIAGWAIGPRVFAFLFPNQVRLDGSLISVLVISSALVAALCISAPAVLARGQHLTYAAGWVNAAVVTVISLALPLELTTRTVLALLAGPFSGLVIHGFALILAKGRSAVDAA